MSNNSLIEAQLPAMATAAAATGSDYKAVVVIFLVGGNDSHNLLYPVSAPDYTNYSTPRANLKLEIADGIAITPSGGYAGPTLKLHPSMVNFAARFTAGNASIVANHGVLSVPTTRAQYGIGYGSVPSVQTPINLFSHSDQQSAMNSLEPNNGIPATGWGGRMMDLFNPSFSPSRTLSNAITAAGNIGLMTGYDTIQYQIGNSGARILSTGSFMDGARGTARNSLMTGSRVHKLEQAYVNIANRAISAGTTVNSALTTAGEFAVTFPTTSAGNQVKIVAKLIKSRAALGARRQIFYVGLGGWDFHSNLKTEQASLLTTVDNAIQALWTAMGEISLQSNVLTLIISEFGRALQQNGDGSDHGWGGHAMLLGGGIIGNRIFGTFPAYGLNTASDAGQGRLIPTTATDEMMANIARWMSVPPVAIPAMIPYIGRFPNALDMFAAVPSAPTITLGTVGGTTQVINVPDTAGTTSKRVEVRTTTGPGAWGTAAGTFAGTAFTVTGLTAGGTSYDYRAFNISSAGESAASNTLTQATSGTTNIVDNFNRADAGGVGTASDGGTWTGLFGATSIVSNKLKFTTAPTAIKRTIPASSLDNFAEIVCSTDALNAGANLCLRGDGTFNNCYRAYSLGDGTFVITKNVGGTPSTLGTSGASGIVVNTPYTFRFIAIGNNLFIFVNGTKILTVTDPTYTTGSDVILRMSNTVATLDDFVAGPSAPVFMNNTPPSQAAGAYSYTYTAAGATSFALTAGSLPAGTSLNTATGAITGTATAGTTSHTISATNAAGTTAGVSRSVTIT